MPKRENSGPKGAAGVRELPTCLTQSRSSVVYRAAKLLGCRLYRDRSRTSCRPRQMGWLLLGLRPTGTRRGVTRKRYGSRAPQVGMSFARQWPRSYRNGGACALMKVVIGVDPHKASLAVAAIDEATGELLERASFPQDRAGLRGLERWAKRFSECRWAVENAGGLGRH